MARDGSRSSARWRLAWLATYPMARFVLGLRVLGREHLTEGAQILASNHVTNVDPVIIGWAAARELHFLAKEELFRASRAFASLIRSWNAWPVRRGAADASAVKHCAEVLRGGNTLVLFPEGTRSRTGVVQEFKSGAGMLALETGVPVVPTLISGLDRSWASYVVDRDFVRRGYRTKPKRRNPVKVVFGEPVRPGGYSDTRAGYEALTKEVEARVRRMAEEVELKWPSGPAVKRSGGRQVAHGGGR